MTPSTSLVSIGAAIGGSLDVLDQLLFWDVDDLADSESYVQEARDWVRYLSSQNRRRSNAIVRKAVVTTMNSLDPFDGEPANADDIREKLGSASAFGELCIFHQMAPGVTPGAAVTGAIFAYARWQSSITGEAIGHA